ncbi:uncharacterized protein LOC118192393 [Stegodyphus dumicola]|uniref:uncharacterized protein LOC118192393 n=1 Tax=Stegodyphus dumicola TaxID=202533 RepID=UPI0015A93345|nr:uncharacterized protein LOC118192393 [Stegodyphus dumicola]
MHSNCWKYGKKTCVYASEIQTFICKHRGRILTHQNFRKILYLYENWWICVGQLKSVRFEQDTLYYIARRAFWSALTDSEYVSKLMIYIYQADAHFGCILCPGIGTSTQLFDDLEQNDLVAEYFLFHLYKKQVTFSGRRLADVEVFYRSLWLHPCELSLIIESPKLLHLLLRYGALIRQDTEDTHINCRTSCYRTTGNILFIILCIVKSILEMNPPGSSRPCQNHSPALLTKYNDLVLCGRIMLRASPQFGPKVFFRLMSGIIGRSLSEMDTAIEWVTKVALPAMVNRTLVPMELKHICRLAIRKRLHARWELPHGIKTLQLPLVLLEYLDLYHD